MEFQVLGFPPDGPTLDLDWRSFSYAGKFGMGTTGKAVLRDGEIVAAAAFNADREDEARSWIRYLSVREDRQGEGLGPTLARSVVETLRERGYATVRIAVNNPIAYRALYRAGFRFTGEETGLAELVLEFPGDGYEGTYMDGLDRFAERDLPPEHAELLAEWRADGTPPEPVNGIP
ncbi:MAG: GNAT family N-acetyltransferase [Halodesulfurarchaeum sp.]